MAEPAADVKKNAGGAFIRPYNAETDYDAVVEIVCYPPTSLPTYLPAF